MVKRIQQAAVVPVLTVALTLSFAMTTRGESPEDSQSSRVALIKGNTKPIEDGQWLVSVEQGYIVTSASLEDTSRLQSESIEINDSYRAIVSRHSGKWSVVYDPRTTMGRKKENLFFDGESYLLYNVESNTLIVQTQDAKAEKIFANFLAEIGMGGWNIQKLLGRSYHPHEMVIREAEQGQGLGIYLSNDKGITTEEYEIVKFCGHYVLAAGTIKDGKKIIVRTMRTSAAGASLVDAQCDVPVKFTAWSQTEPNRIVKRCTTVSKLTEPTYDTDLTFRQNPNLLLNVSDYRIDKQGTNYISDNGPLGIEDLIEIINSRQAMDRHTKAVYDRLVEKQK